MITRGFAGFKTNTKEDRKNNLCGIYFRHNADYPYTGMEILDIYKNNTREYFKDIFKSIIWVCDDSDDLIKGTDLFNGECFGKVLFNFSDFLNNGLLCEYGYVYNLETDELEIYRGLFKEPQFEELRKLGFKAYDDTEVYHTHRVLTITRDSDFDAIESMFEKGIDAIDKQERVLIKDGKYLEEIYLRNNAINLEAIMAIIDEYI